MLLFKQVTFGHILNKIGFDDMTKPEKKRCWQCVKSSNHILTYCSMLHNHQYILQQIELIKA